jgi:predicted ATPase
MSSRIVITGAPGSGKSEFLNRLRELPRLRRFTFLEEIARQLLSENPAYRRQPLEFHQMIYQEQVQREEALHDRPFISDRGTIDAFAFHPETLVSVGTTLEREYRRYTSVIQLGSSASLGPDFYAVDEIRNESADDALAIERALKNVWRDHSDYHFVKARTQYESKYTELVEILDKCVARTSEIQ